MVVCPTCRTRYGVGTTACPLDGTDLRGAAVSSEEARPADPAPAAPPAELRAGDMLDHRLRILRPLGQGGMGTVYAALHVGLGKEVAVKVLVDRYSHSGEVAQRLKQEARLAAAIHDPHIVEVFDIGEAADGRTFLVMELLRGESLAQRLHREHVLPEEDALRIARQIAAALQAAHRAGVMHRDVKPENVFLCLRQAEPEPGGQDGADSQPAVGEGVTAEPLVKLLDFGLSKAVRTAPEQSLRLTQTGMIMGTPLYMSPEQARGAEDLDHRVDLYALGVVLYECLTGEVPFRANNYLGVISKILTEPAPRPRQRRPEISAAAEQVVLRAMAPDRDARYQSAAALVADLDAALGRRPLSQPALAAVPGGRGGADGAPAGHPERGAPGLRVLLGGAALLLALALLWLLPVTPPAVSASSGDAAVARPAPRDAAEPAPRDAAEPAPDAVVAAADGPGPGGPRKPPLRPRPPPRPAPPAPQHDGRDDGADPELAPLPAPLRRAGGQRGTLPRP